jgi:putative protein kinase ArgK-like GTPase of G3E family
MPSYADSPETLHILQDFPAVRMERLSGQPDAFIRPSPFRGYLGGVA